MYLSQIWQHQHLVVVHPIRIVTFEGVLLNMSTHIRPPGVNHYKDSLNVGCA